MTCRTSNASSKRIVRNPWFGRWTCNVGTSNWADQAKNYNWIHRSHIYDLNFTHCSIVMDWSVVNDHALHSNHSFSVGKRNFSSLWLEWKIYYYIVHFISVKKNYDSLVKPFREMTHTIKNSSHKCFNWIDS